MMPPVLVPDPDPDEDEDVDSVPPMTTPMLYNTALARPSQRKEMAPCWFIFAFRTPEVGVGAGGLGLGGRRGGERGEGKRVDVGGDGGGCFLRHSSSPSLSSLS